ncbi:MAG: DUF2059 domain-containing protein [Lysobacterales bacterium]|nr:DUF2059 domain-containing protein [Xanthomonadales bacterium]MCP5473368.1 DUF2059 domain-containing protein [Rhodanobacteraceae bacterium]
MLSALLLVATLSAADSAPAADGAHVKAALDLIAASRTDQMFDQMKNPTEPMVKSTVAQFQGCESAQPVLDEFSKAMAAVSFSDEQIEKIRHDVAVVYTEVFTQSELEEMTRFFKSATGVKMLEKMPDVMQKMQAAQMQGQATMQEGYKIAQGFGPRLEEAYKTCAAAAAPAEGQTEGQ